MIRMDTYNHNEFSVEGTKITHVPSGAWWTFNFNSPEIQSQNIRNLDRPIFVSAVARGIWGLRLRQKAELAQRP
jgi:hypothetical protein